jgi:hypothetical protein
MRRSKPLDHWLQEPATLKNRRLRCALQKWSLRQRRGG